MSHLIALDPVTIVKSQFTSRLIVLPLLFASFLLGGCASMSNHSSGFLESYEHLKPDPKDSHRLVYERADWKKSDYTGVLIEPAVVCLTPEDQEKITAKEMADLAAYSDKALRKRSRKSGRLSPPPNRERYESVMRLPGWIRPTPRSTWPQAWCFVRSTMAA
jgi:hypothetical protein